MALKHPHYQLAKALFTALYNNVTVSGTTYPVYQGIPSTPASVYVRIGEIIEILDGTKDDFMHMGSVAIIVNDESQIGNADLKLAFSIQEKVRTLLKTSRSNVLTMTGFTMDAFTPDTSSVLVGVNDKDQPQVQCIDIYRFIIE